MGCTEKKQWGCKPGSVLLCRHLLGDLRAVPAIYLLRRSRDASIVLPSSLGGPPSLVLAARVAAVDASLVYANFPPPVCTARMSPCAW